MCLWPIPLLALLLAILSSCAAADDLAGAPNGPWRRLFLDDARVARQSGLRRVFHPARKHPGNPVIKKTEPWEGFGPYVHGTVLREGDRLRMWYFIYSGRYMNAYAESSDGLTWLKPKLGLCEFKGAKDNNLILSDEKVTALALNLSVIQSPTRHPLPREGRSFSEVSSYGDGARPWVVDPAQRYIAFFNSLASRPLRQAFAVSPDGIHWTIGLDTLKGLSSGDEMRVFYDPYERRYVATCKTGKARRGRAASIALSPDGVQWQRINAGEPVVYSLETGKQAHQIYNMAVFPYQGLYIGLPNTYHAGWPDHDPPVRDGELAEGEKDTPTTGEIEIAWSRDLTAWQRPPGAGQCPFIALGPSGAFDSGMVMGVANAPVIMGDELWFYYGGWDGPHRSATRNAAIGLATLRLDGFVSLAADAEGWLITPPEAFTKPAVLVNAKVAPGGKLVAELLDDHDRPILGFDRRLCEPFTGDSVRHQLTWRDAAQRGLPAGARPKLRFFLSKAELYSYRPT